MFWRAWCFLVGLAPGALGALAFASGPLDPPWTAVQLGALAGGAVLLLAASLMARRPNDEPDRGAHFARAASAGLVALPALAATLLGLAPGPRVWLGVTVALLVVCFLLASRRRAPAGGLAGQLAAGATSLLGGTVAVGLVAGILASLDAPPPEWGEAARRAVFDHDATIETAPFPSCVPRAARVEALSGSGAHPRLESGGSLAWFDAPGPDGRRQIHRLDRATGVTTCMTCDEPGNNRHPAPSRDGGVVLFDTDRYATWRRPANTEIQLLKAAAAARGIHSRRITYSPGPDEHPVFAPAANTLAWSRGEGGSYRVVSSGLVSGHGSLQVGRVGTLWSGGTRWLAPLAWAPDARTLAVARGNPLGPARVEAVDPGRNRRIHLGETVATAGSLSFSEDGGWYVLATGRRDSVAGLLPDAFGFVLAPLLSRGPRLRGTEVLWGPTRGEPRVVDLGESAEWGWPTGVSLEPDGKGFVLGQRRETSDGVEERLVAVTLDCS